ncbi:putative sensor kinase protein [Burkholderia thailandensis]|uniref:Sensor kinase protein n=1 Tax=Burkholderia thailandensis TaxID=57975 RepID=A0AAW9D375_BURTH|nr:putative sensor kinase protein [Burkholderia thailandensis]MDW9257628.1 putative sensor kinase protein [Burkholderia thailandensis]
MISSVVASRSRETAWALVRVVTEISLFRNLISDFYQL